jgi:hypothetical protein
MDLEYVKQCLPEYGWKNVRAGSYAGTSFDLVGARRYFLDQWLILVKVIPALDMKMVQEVEEIYNFVAIKSFNQLWSKKIPFIPGYAADSAPKPCVTCRLPGTAPILTTSAPIIPIGGCSMLSREIRICLGQGKIWRWKKRVRLTTANSWHKSTVCLLNNWNLLASGETTFRFG